MGLSVEFGWLFDPRINTILLLFSSSSLVNSLQGREKPMGFLQTKIHLGLGIDLKI